MLSSLVRCNKNMGRLFLSIRRTISTSTRLSSAACSSGSVTRFFKQVMLFKPFQHVVCALLTLQLAMPTSRFLHPKWLTLRMNGLTVNQATTIRQSLVMLQKKNYIGYSVFFTMPFMLLILFKITRQLPFIYTRSTEPSHSC